ncbi:MAG: aminotransferase class V-fold PLP-dependent enzyme, partial [Oscillospiraceae bacterium]|nr:aminotransferase class V-fold PLP-dependent enzyme [Oscillospiraceae bacterium]
LRGAAAVYGKRQRHIVTSAVEHAIVRSTMDVLESQGFHVTRILPDADGVFHAQDFIDAVTEDTCLISMMLVENETGRILPVGDVFRRLKKKFPKLITHCDAVQGFMKLPVRVNSLNADLLSISAHKIHGPKGVGALYIRKGVRLQPLTTGGKQENAIRPGTEAVPLIVGFGAAVQYMQPTIQERFTAVQAKREALLQILSEMEGITVNSIAEGSPYIVNFSVDGIRSETMLHFLEDEEIYVSSGSACSKGTRSGVLLAYGIPDDRADSAIRVSFSEETTDEDLTLLTTAIARGQASLVHKKR